MSSRNISGFGIEVNAGLSTATVQSITSGVQAPITSSTDLSLHNLTSNQVNANTVLFNQYNANQGLYSYNGFTGTNTPVVQPYYDSNKWESLALQVAGPGASIKLYRNPSSMEFNGNVTANNTVAVTGVTNLNGGLQFDSNGTVFKSYWGTGTIPNNSGGTTSVTVGGTTFVTYNTTIATTIPSSKKFIAIDGWSQAAAIATLANVNVSRDGPTKPYTMYNVKSDGTIGTSKWYGVQVTTIGGYYNVVLASAPSWSADVYGAPFTFVIQYAD